MSDAVFWQAAQEVCTAKQLRVLELRERYHFSLRQIALTTNLSPATVRGHLEAAHRNVEIALRDGREAMH